MPFRLSTWMGQIGQRLRAAALVLVAVLFMLSALPTIAHASLHTYHERAEQTTYRSRQSLRDYDDRAWQVIAFKRLQRDALQGIYLRLVAFPGTVIIDRQRPVTLVAATGQSWQLKGALDPQTQDLPESVWQYDLQPLLKDLNTALPLEMQIPVIDATPAEAAIAPFIVREWLQVKTASN